MEITINLEKKFAFLVITILLIASGFFLVKANTPNPGHLGDRIWIKSGSNENTLNGMMDSDTYVSRHGDISSRNILSPRPRHILPHFPTCYKDCKADNNCGISNIDYNMQSHRVCGISIFGNAPNSGSQTSFVKVSPISQGGNYDWDYDLKNVFTQINCIDPTIDFSSPPSSAC